MTWKSPKHRRTRKARKNKHRKKTKKRRKSRKTKKHKSRNSSIPELSLFKDLTRIHSPASQEERATNFLMKYINENKKSWKYKPRVFNGGNFKNNIVLVFGKPKLAVFSHVDNVGFTVAHEKTLLPIGGPEFLKNAKLRGYDSNGTYVETKLRLKKYQLLHSKKDNIEIGTNLTYLPDWTMKNKFLQSGNIDDKFGVLMGLLLAKTLKNGIIVFSAGEEIETGNLPFLIKFLFERYKIKNTVIADVTMKEKNLKMGKGPCVTIRDEDIPDRKYVDRVIHILRDKMADFQIAVGDEGSSDGKAIMLSPYPVDTVFIGPCIKNMHTPHEIIHVNDFSKTLKVLQILFQNI